MSAYTDPLTQDGWIRPLMSIDAHLWKAGSKTSVCGLPWSMAAQAWNATTEKPAKDVCQKCGTVSEEPKHAAP